MRILPSFLLVVVSSTVLDAENLRWPELLQGSWERTDTEAALLFEEDRVLVYEGRHLTALGLERLEPDSDVVVVRKAGRAQRWKLSLEAGRLNVKGDTAPGAYRKLPSTPPRFDLKARVFGPAFEVPEQRVKEIQEELRRRVARDQAVRMNPDQASRMNEIDAENTGYLWKLLEEIGWIDVKRFGAKTAQDAILLVQHSRDLGLALASLPSIERDFKTSKDADFFALVYDRLQNDLGRKQRYGTQLWDAPDGPAVLPLEDPERVDDLRKEIGLPPLSEYLAEASRILFEGKPVRMPRFEE